MRHCGCQVIMKEGKTHSLPVKELIRELDAEEEEDTKKKFNKRAELVEKRRN